jgi:hypothetical protein
MHGTKGFSKSSPENLSDFEDGVEEDLTNFFRGYDTEFP